MVPDKLDLGLDFSLNQDASSDDSLDMETETIGINLGWQVRRPTQTRPGWQVWLRGERQDIRDDVQPGNNRSPYQIFVGLRMDWPTRLGTAL